MSAPPPGPPAHPGRTAARLQAPLIVAVLTYKRPADLAVALPRLIAQAGTAPVPAQVLVVDNDPEAGAAGVVEAVNDPALVYVHEPRPGIAAARNRALNETVETADLLVFIDDDEVPSEHWLRALVGLHQESGAAAVAGPVISEYAVPPDPWLAAGEFFARRRLPTGTKLDVAATNNLLLDLAQVQALDLRFDERFGLSGGSDTLFSRQLVQSGAVMLWCDEATVVDRVPAARLTRGWVLRRAFRSGNCLSRVRLATTPTSTGRLAARMRLLLPGVVRTAGGAARYLVGAATASRRHQAKGLRTAARGAGIILGAFGYVYSEYKRP